MTPPIPPEASKEIETVRGFVAKHFPVYDVRVSYDVVEFFVRVDMATLDDSFEKMREEMGKNGYIPMISYVGGEHIVTVARKPAVKYRGTIVNVIMLAVTLVTTIVAGTIYWAGYDDLPELTFDANTISMGFLTFALPVMAILGVHELGHYFMARKRKVAASLPFFMPFLPPLGTLGAFISLRDPIPNKKTLLEIGVAGPIAGFLLTIPIALIGLDLTDAAAKPVPVNVGSEGVVGISFPLVYLGLEYLVPITGDYLLHPVAFAAWVGFLVTAINLLPAGQLDGGHIGRALLGSNAKYLSWAVVAILIGMVFFYPGWLLFALLVLFLGTKHPPPLNDISPLDVKRKGLGIFSFVILVIAFVPVPLSSIDADYSFELDPLEDTNYTMSPGGSHVFAVMVQNTGNAYNEIHFIKEQGPASSKVAFKPHDSSDSHYDVSYLILLNASQEMLIDIAVSLAVDASPAENASVVIKANSMNASVERNLLLNITVGSPVLTFAYDSEFTIPAGDSANGTIQVNNTGPAVVNLTFDSGQDVPWFMNIVLYSGSPGDPGASPWLNVTVPAYSSIVVGFTIYVWSPATPGSYPVSVLASLDESGSHTLLETLGVTVNVV